MSSHPSQLSVSEHYHRCHLFCKIRINWSCAGKMKQERLKLDIFVFLMAFYVQGNSYNFAIILDKMERLIVQIFCHFWHDGENSYRGVRGMMIRALVCYLRKFLWCTLPRESSQDYYLCLKTRKYFLVWCIVFEILQFDQVRCLWCEELFDVPCLLACELEWPRKDGPAGSF